MNFWVVEVLRHGYMILFVSLYLLLQTSVAHESYSPSSVGKRALDLQIQVQLQKRAVEAVDSDPGYYSRMFVVPKATGVWRPIISLSDLSLHARKTRFHMVTIQSVLRFVRKGTGWSP